MHSDQTPKLYEQPTAERIVLQSLDVLTSSGGNSGIGNGGGNTEGGFGNITINPF